MEHILNTLPDYIAQRLQKTILAKGRNHGRVCIKIEPFFPIYFNELFVSVCDQHNETWQSEIKKSKRAKKTVITIRDYFADLDAVLGGKSWRSTEVYIPFPGTETGKLLDGYWVLNSDMVGN